MKDWKSLEAWLEENRFQKCAEMGLVNGEKLFISCSDFPKHDHPGVYLWVSEGEYPPLYTGKAGKGIERRLEQHIGGFNSEKKETRRKKLILDFLKVKKKFDVYFRRSDTTKIFEKEVTLNAAEEHALYEKFSPPWNIAGFPKIQGEDLADKSPDPIDEAVSQDRLPFDFEGLPHSDDANIFWDSLSREDKTTFLEIFKALDQLGFTKKLDCRLIGTYTDLGKYSYKNTIAFGLLAKKQFKKHSWFAKIPLAIPPTVFFPDSIVDRDKKFKEHKNNFVPSDLGDFCNTPWSYINHDKFKSQIPGITDS